MKLAQVKKIMNKKKIDLCFLIHPDPTITYLTSFETSYSLFLINKDSAILYVTSLDNISSNSLIKVEQIPKRWKKHFFSNNKLNIGINKENMSVSFFEELKKIYPRSKFVDVHHDLAQLRITKTDEEISHLKKACTITKNAYLDLIDNFSTKKFKTEQDIATYLEIFMKNKSCTIAFPTIVASGMNSSVPHHTTSSQKLSKGFVQLDFGARYKNYCADMSRVLYIGKPSLEEKKRFNILYNSQKESRHLVSQGIKCKDLDSFCRNKLGKYSSHFIHSLGHGVGVEIHEDPRLSPSSGHTIKRNMVFTIEPGIYFYNQYGMRIEDTVLFNGKLKILTNVNRNLTIL